MQAAPLGIGDLLFMHIGLILFCIPGKIVFQGTRLGIGAIHNYGMVDLFHLLLLKHQGHPAQGLAGFCKDYRPAYRSVQAVGNSHKNFPGFMVPLLNIVLHQFIQGYIAGLIPLNNIRSALIDNHQVIVLIQNGNRRL